MTGPNGGTLAKAMTSTAARWAVIAAAALALAACAPRHQAAPPSSQASGGSAGAPVDDTHLTPEQLEAKAQAAEAEANRLLAQAGQPPADQVAPGAAPAQHSLGPTSEKLGSGQYYDTISFEGQPGQAVHLDYQAHGFTPMIVVMGPDRQVFSQSRAFGTATHLDDDITPDRAGTWYVLLSATDVGAGGTYEVNMQKVTERPLN